MAIETFPSTTRTRPLARAVHKGELLASELVDASIAAIEARDVHVNAVIERDFERARSDAKRIDSLSKQERKRLPLAGVPCTIKQCFEVDGLPWVVGSTKRVGIVGKRDATTVKRLRDAGAIVMGVTNTSELCLWTESMNPVYGTTNNPYALGHTAGGSSGGEGAAQAAGLVAFGLGSDVGGSIRIPSAFNGIFGHKPSGGLVPSSGQFPGADGLSQRALVSGPMSRHARDLRLLLHLLQGPDNIDRSAVRGHRVTKKPELDLDTAQPLKHLRVVIPEHQRWRRLSDDVKAAINRAALYLEEGGARIELIEMPELDATVEMWAMTMRSHMNESTEYKFGAGKRLELLKQLRKLARRKSEHTFPALFLSAAERLPMPERVERYWRKRLYIFRQRFEQLIDDNTVVLYPSFPSAAPKHHGHKLMPFAWTWSGIWNPIEVPATAVPMGLNANGLPLGIQIIARRFNDGLTLDIAEFLESRGCKYIAPGLVVSLKPE